MAATVKISRRPWIDLLRCLTSSSQTVKSILQRPTSKHLRQDFRCLTTTKFYRKRSSKVDPDPRKNTQYQYFPGDPLQEDAIRSLENRSPLSLLAKADKKADQKKKEVITKSNAISQTASDLKFENLKEGDVRLGRKILAVKSNNHNSGSELIFLEGQRLIKDALLLGAEAQCLYFCEPEILNSFPKELLESVALYKISYKNMKVWSDTSTPAGLIGLFKKPSEGVAVSPLENPLPITLIYDSLKDPGNAGTLLRTAAAVGCQQVITTKGTVDVWESKVLRSAMGGHFCLPIYTGLSWADIPNYLTDNTQVFLANSRPTHMLERAFDQKFMSEDVDNILNASESDSDAEDFSKYAKSRSELKKEVNAEDMAYAFHKVPLTVYDYSEMLVNHPADDGKNMVHVALVVGGETEGLSALAKKFAYSHFGHYVTVPMSEAVESLNTSIAASVILYELRKKILMLRQDQPQ